jgi:hypothetical protein
MGLDSVVEKVSHLYQHTKNFVKEEKIYFEASVFFLSTRALDVITSNYVISEYGHWGEVAPVTKYFMKLYGPATGMLVEQAAIGSLVLLASYYLNKKKTRLVSGNNLLIGAGVASLGISAVNFLEYQGTPVLMPVLKFFDSIHRSLGLFLLCLW